MNCIENKWVKYILNLFATGVFFMFLFMVAEFGFYKAMPMTFWLEYHNVRPTATVVLSPERPMFESHYTLSRKVKVSYLDVLRCNDTRISELVSHAYMTKIGDNKPVWTYQAEITRGLCYLESNITVNLPYGITKRQKIIGDNFMIK